MLYGLLRIIFTFIYSVIFPTTVKGKENIPKEGAVILAANHFKQLGSSTGRNIHTSSFGLYG